MIDLSVSRERIDEIDSQIVALFEQRMAVANEVAKYKMENGRKVYDRQREEEKLECLSAMSHGAFNEHAVRELFSQIMSISRKYKYGVLPHTEDVTDFVRVDGIAADSDTKVYYFGAPGSHTQQAMENFFAPRVQGISCQSFQGVMAAVQEGAADYGVLPIENSSTGGITANYDLLLDFRNAIVGQYVMKIDQCLVGLPGVSLKEIRRVYSHPQGLAQCRRFLNERMPGRATLTATSTAESARMAAADPTVAGIANAFAAEVHGAQVAVRDIEDHFGNQTVFALIGRPGAAPALTGERMKTSLALFMREDRAGTLHMILSEFAFAGINLTMVQSRPTKQQLGDYMFFIEFAGAADSLEAQTALNCLRMKLREVKVLGSYPVF